MNWAVFAVALWVALALERGLAPLLAIPDATTGVSPSFVLVLVVWIALQAPSLTALWAAIAAGLVLDALGTHYDGRGGLLGPHALGYALGAYAVLQMRGMVFRQSGLTLGVMTFVAGVFAHLAIVALMALRGFPLGIADPVPGWDTSAELVGRFMQLLYTALAAAILAIPLRPTVSWWGFPSAKR
ncbi:MAG: rod shape-determining protein MreD [Planctomycetota bacterium]